MGIATIHATAGILTFGLPLPQAEVWDGVRVVGVDPLETQNDVKCWWPDGSIKFLIVSTDIPTEGDYTLMTAPPVTEKFFAEWPTGVQVFLSVFGDGDYTAVLPEPPSGADPWLRGSLVEERRVTITPRDAKDKPHYSLRVIFDVRVYRTGQTALDVTVENVLDKRDAATVSYYVEVYGNNQVLFKHPPVRHTLFGRWRQVFRWGGEFSDYTPDFEKAFAAGAVPRYRGNVSDEIGDPHSPLFDILQPGSLNRWMPDHAGRAEIAPYPDWAARYLVWRYPLQKPYVLLHGDLAGSWPIHIRNDDVDGSLISIDQRPQYWYQWQGATPPDGPVANVGSIPFYDPKFQPEGLTPDNNHQPSLAYIPYLITGDRYYADEMAFWANFCLLHTDWEYRGYQPGVDGHLGLLHANETRGYGWTLRNLTDAAAWLPDAHPLKKYFALRVTNNLEWADWYAARREQNPPLNPLHIFWWYYKRPESTSQELGVWDRIWIAMWEQNYVCWALDHASKQGFVGGLNHRTRLVEQQYDWFNDEFMRPGAAPYIIAVATHDPPGSFQNIVFYPKFRQLYQGPTQFAGYYGTDAYMMLVLAEEQGFQFAAVHREWLLQQDGMEAYLRERSGFALLPPSQL